MSGRLPEGYTEVEYIKYSPSKTFILGGFSSQEKAAQRIEQLQNNCKSSAYSIVANCRQIIEAYGILIPEEAIPFLTTEEKKAIIEQPKNVQFIENCPIVYRFMGEKGEKYVDEFFSTGVIRLSTFNRCKYLEDANRKDASEGRAMLIGQEKESRVEMDMGVGDNAVLLCTSLSSNNVKANGEVDDCCIEIRDINSFVMAITDALLQQGHHVHSVIKGPCVYSDRVIQKNFQGGMLKNYLDEMFQSTQIDLDELFGLGKSISRDDIFFCKPLENRVENEYRILWLLEEDVTQDTYDVIIPNARQFCRKIKFNNE